VLVQQRFRVQASGYVAVRFDARYLKKRERKAVKADPFPLVVLLLFFITVAGFACLFPLAQTFGQNTANTPRVDLAAILPNR
jgi:hypothetical protein